MRSHRNMVFPYQFAKFSHDRQVIAGLIATDIPGLVGDVTACEALGQFWAGENEINTASRCSSRTGEAFRPGIHVTETIYIASIAQQADRASWSIHRGGSIKYCAKQLTTWNRAQQWIKDAQWSRYHKIQVRVFHHSSRILPVALIQLHYVA